MNTNPKASFKLRYQCEKVGRASVCLWGCGGMLVLGCGVGVAASSLQGELDSA